MCSIVDNVRYKGGDGMSDSKNMILEKIGARIRDARTNANMSQAELAEKADIHLSHFTRIENGQVEMRVETLIRILEALEISADWILRANVPASDTVYDSEYVQLLEGCAIPEKASIVSITKEVKKQFDTLRKEHIKSE